MQNIYKEDEMKITVTKIFFTVFMMFSLVLLNASCGGGGSILPFLPGPDDLPWDDTFVEEDDPADEGPGGEETVFADLDDDGIPDSEDNDADGDGFLVTEDDCDDMNPTIFPGAPDKPDFPGYLDSNCDGVDGDLLLAYWVATDGNDANPGTIDQPFLTIQHAIDVAKSDLADVKDVYVVGGVYNEDATLVEGVGLYGGYGPLTGEGARARDIGLHQSIYKALFGIFFVGATSTGFESVVEGMFFISLPDTPAFVVINASPEIRHNKIIGAASVANALAVYAMALGDGQLSEAVFEDNLIESGDCSADACTSVAVIVTAWGNDAASSPKFLGNDIRSGDAVHSSIGVLVAGDNVTTTSLTAIKNNIEAGTAGTFTAGIVTGYDPFEAAMLHFTKVDILQNRIYGGSNAMFAYGVVLLNGSGLSKITNNFITGGYDVTFEATGIYLSTADANIRHNTINSGSSDMSTVSVMLSVAATAKIDNNIFFSIGGTTSVGVREPFGALNPASLQNNLFDDILTVKYQDVVFGDIVDIAALNAMADIAVIGGNIDGDSAFTSIADRDYHLLSWSDAIDVGLDVGETALDIDDDARPVGDAFDIGADEYAGE